MYWVRVYIIYWGGIWRVLLIPRNLHDPNILYHTIPSDVLDYEGHAGILVSSVFWGGQNVSILQPC